MLDTLMTNLAEPVHFYGVTLALMITALALLMVATQETPHS